MFRVIGDCGIGDIIIRILRVHNPGDARQKAVLPGDTIVARGCPTDIVAPAAIEPPNLEGVHYSRAKGKDIRLNFGLVFSWLILIRVSTQLSASNAATCMAMRGK